MLTYISTTPPKSKVQITRRIKKHLKAQRKKVLGGVHVDSSSTVITQASDSSDDDEESAATTKRANHNPTCVNHNPTRDDSCDYSTIAAPQPNNMILKAVKDGASVRTSLTRRSTTSAVTTATARSFYSLSSRRGRKAITAARLASRTDITPPLALPPSAHRSDRSSERAVNGDAATASMFDEYFSMGVGGDHNEEEGSPQGCLITCCVDDSFNFEFHHDETNTDTEDLLDEGAWDNYEWHELPNHVRNAACLLGCTSSKAWACGGVKCTNDKSWNELSSVQIKAARVFGFNQRLWDDEADEQTRSHDAVRGFDTYREVVQHDRETGMITNIALPATWETILELFSGAIQVALISQYLGQDALDAYAVVEGCLFVAYNIGSGLADAEEILVCQALGMEDTFLAGQYTLLSIATYLILAAPMYITLIFFIDEIIIGLGLSAEAASLAMFYIPVLSLSHLFSDSFAGTLSSLLRCDGKYLQIAIIDSIFNVLHAALVAVAVVRLELDLVGMAWMEVLSTVIYGVFIYAFAAATGWLQPFWGGLTDLRVLLSPKSIKNMMSLAFPLALTEVISSGEWSVLSLFASWMGGVDLNAWTILGSLWSLFSYAPEGINCAAVMRLAFHLGRGDPRSAKVAGYKCLAYSGFLSLAVSVTYFLWHKEIIALFTNSALIAATLENSVMLIAVGNVVMGLGGTASVVLTAQGRPGIATWSNAIAVWGISVPLSAWFTFDLEYNTTGLVCSMLIAYTTYSLIVLSCVFTTNWVKASMDTIAAEAEEEESFNGDDTSTIAQGSLGTKDAYNNHIPEVQTPRQALISESTQDVDTLPIATLNKETTDRIASTSSAGLSDTCTSVSRAAAGTALPPMPCYSDISDGLSQYGTETIMSPYGLLPSLRTNNTTAFNTGPTLGHRSEVRAEKGSRPGDSVEEI